MNRKYTYTRGDISYTTFLSPSALVSVCQLEGQCPAGDKRFRHPPFCAWGGRCFFEGYAVLDDMSERICTTLTEKDWNKFLARVEDVTE